LIRLLNVYFPSRTIFLGVSEACLIAVAFLVATVVWFGANDATVVLSYEQGFLKILVVATVFITCMYYFDLYSYPVLNNPREVLTRMIQTQGTVCILLAGLYYLYPPVRMGRGIFLSGLVLVAMLLLLWRRLFLLLNTLPRFAEPTLILGDGPLAGPLLAELRSHPELGIRVVGQLNMPTGGDDGLAQGSNEERFESFLNMVKVYEPDRIIVALGERRGTLPVEALLQLKSAGVRVEDGSEVYETVTGKVPLESLHPSWLLFSPGFRVSPLLLIYKRIASILISSIALVLSLPAMALIALAIRTDSAGPVIFRQKRIGRGGKIFTLYKFRTMFDGADQNGNHPPAELSDPRFTRLGRLLRRSHFDELPQFFNILRGDMHFVGPRPFVPNQEYECLQKIPYYRQRWLVTPGATGWAQVNRGYCVTIEDNAEKLAYDLFYIKNISIGLDLLILFQSLKTLLLGRGSR
jgi:exopolysaccharide biosynthesis polyprenyl glycosylphosphotransferase